MHRAHLPLKGFILGLCLLGSLLGVVPLALSEEIEPNNSCATAQDFGTVAVPFTLEGSLDLTPELRPDVDFFRFTGAPGSVVQVDLEGQSTGQGTLEDPFLGLFNSTCTLSATDDDGGVDLNPRLVFPIPADGIFVLAVTRCCDFGGGFGTYRLTVTSTSSIGSISGRVVDAVTGTPLPGDTFPFAAVGLLRCDEARCLFVNFSNADSEGRFQFTVDFNENPLVVGTYQVRASTEDHFTDVTDPFEVGEGEDRDLGDLQLQPLPIQVSEIQSCGDLPPEGGQCRYNVRIGNRQAVSFQGAAWSVVESFGVNSLAGFTRFQPRRPQSLTLDPEKSRVVHWSVQVPNTLGNGTGICTDVFVGQGESPLFNTIRQRFLFCITKGVTGAFSVLSAGEVAKLRQQMQAQSVRPPKKKGGLVQLPEDVR